MAPAIREVCGVNATFIADGVPQFALVNGLYAMDKDKPMTTPTRRISFYLKPAAVKSEQEACNYLDSLQPPNSRAQRAAFLAG